MAHSPACLYAPSTPDRQWKLEARVPQTWSVSPLRTVTQMMDLTFLVQRSAEERATEHVPNLFLCPRLVENHVSGMAMSDSVLKATILCYRRNCLSWSNGVPATR